MDNVIANAPRRTLFAAGRIPPRRVVVAPQDAPRPTVDTQEAA